MPANNLPGPESSRFYVTGGNLAPDAPSYVERQADADLYEGLRRGELCYVLTSRQMGKSSLMVRTAARLRKEGVAVATVELTAIGRNVTVEQWYDGLLRHIAQQLGMETELETFWQAHSRLGPLQRWVAALREVVLEAGVGGWELGVGATEPRADPSLSAPNSQLPTPNPPLVVFIDEIDAVRSLPFSTDEFFAAIRECYNRRSEDPVFNRLTFCLLGVATPSDLIRDTRTTPFNVGRRIDLTDFTAAEAAPLAQGLVAGEGALSAGKRERAKTRQEPEEGPLRASAPDVSLPSPSARSRFRPFAFSCRKERPTSAEAIEKRAAPAILQRILYWTGGHPYLTQCLCQAVAEATAQDCHPKSKRPEGTRNPKFCVDRLCEALFLCPQARERDNNLLFVRERLLRSEVDLAALLELYARVRRGRRVRDDEVNPLVTVLRLSGITRAAAGHLHARNRIYQRVFDRHWVAEHMPDAEVRRQRAAYRLGLLRATAALTAILAVVSGLALYALNQAQRADRNAVRAAARAREAHKERDAAVRARNGERIQLSRAEAAARAAMVARHEAEQERQAAVQQQQIARTKQAEAERERSHAARAEQQATQRLWESYLSQARALRWSGRAGRRFDALAVLAKAAAIRPTLALRNEAIACMALADIRTDQHSIPFPPGSTSIAFDHAYRRYARGDMNGNITVRYVADDREIVHLPGFGTRASEIRLSNTGNQFLAAFYGDGGDRRTRHFWVWDLPRRRAVLRLEPNIVPNSRVDFAPDDHWIAVGFEDHSIQLYHLPSGEEFRRLPPGPLLGTLQISPGGHRLAASSLEDPLVRIYNVDTGSLLTSLRHPAPVWGLTWGAGGRLLGTACVDRCAYVWDAATGQKLAAMVGHQADVTDVAFSQDGSLLASVSWDETIRLWDTYRGQQLVSGSGVVVTPQLSPNDRLLGSFSDSGKIRLIELATGHECRTLDTLGGRGQDIWGLNFSPDGRLLASAGTDGVRLWYLPDSSEIGYMPIGLTRSVIFSLTGRNLITSGDHGLYRWPLQTSSARGEIRIGTGQRFALAGGTGYAASTPDGRILAVLGSGRVRILDAKNPSRMSFLVGQPGVLTIAVSPDGKYVATGARLYGKEQVRVWNLTRGSVGHDLPKPGRAYLAFSPDSKRMVAGQVSEYRSWSVNTWATARPVQRRSIGYFAGPVAFSGDGKTLAIARAPQLAQLIDPANGKELATLEVPNPGILTWFCFSPDGSRLAASAANGLIYLWDLRLIRRQLAVMGLDWHDSP